MTRAGFTDLFGALGALLDRLGVQLPDGCLGIVGPIVAALIVAAVVASIVADFRGRRRRVDDIGQAEVNGEK